MNGNKDWHSSNFFLTCKTSRLFKLKVFIDDKQVGKIGDKGFIYQELSAGTHSIYFKGLLYTSEVTNFEINKPYLIDMVFSLFFKGKVKIRSLTIGQKVERYFEIMSKRKRKEEVIRSDYEPYTDEELDTYDLLDGD